jgi:hypothetical protein
MNKKQLEKKLKNQIDKEGVLKYNENKLIINII